MVKVVIAVVSEVVFVTVLVIILVVAPRPPTTVVLELWVVDLLEFFVNATTDAAIPTINKNVAAMDTSVRIGVHGPYFIEKNLLLNRKDI